MAGNRFDHWQNKLTDKQSDNLRKNEKAKVNIAIKNKQENISFPVEITEGPL